MQESILIVDDSQAVRKVMRGFLEKQDKWTIAGEAGDGVEAIRLAIETKPDLILLDFLMPNMNGIEAASVLKKTLPDVRIILFTMFDESLGSTLSSAAGVDMVISKPEGLTNLVKCVQYLMESAGLQKSRKALEDTKTQAPS